MRGLLWGSTTLVAVTGLLYAALRYLVVGDDPFSAYNHPAQPWALDGHILLAPVLLLALGWFWGTHVLPKLRQTTRARFSGLILIALIAGMTASGYLLQVSSLNELRAALAWAHGIAGGLFVAILLGHAWSGRRERGATGRTSPAQEDPMRRRARLTSLLLLAGVGASSSCARRPTEVVRVLHLTGSAEESWKGKSLAQVLEVFGEPSSREADAEGGTILVFRQARGSVRLGSETSDEPAEGRPSGAAPTIQDPPPEAPRYRESAKFWIDAAGRVYRYWMAPGTEKAPERPRS